MKVGFLGFGEVASALSKGLMDNGVEVYTCVHGRSEGTKKLAEKIGVKLYSSNHELAENMDILISTVVPSSAVEVAVEVGNLNGVYVDLNNVSPKTVKLLLGSIETGKTVDAAIIGSVRNGLNVKILASGPFVDEFTELNNYGMNIVDVGIENGMASGIKLLRSAYTKGVSALLFQSIYAAYKIGIDKEVLDYIGETEGTEFEKSAISRIISSAVHADRRADEMDEVVEMLSEYQNPIMSQATEAFFRELSLKITKPGKRPANYEEVFNLFDMNDQLIPINK